MPERMPDVPKGYVVFELAWCGCWHYRRDGEPMSRCYDSERTARIAAHQDLKMADMLTCRR